MEIVKFLKLRSWISSRGNPYEATFCLERELKLSRISLDPHLQLILGVSWVWLAIIEACEKSFQELKKRFTTAPVLTLPECTQGFVVYCDASRFGLGCVLMQNGKLELLKDYDMSILYHRGKANVVADTLSRLSMGSTTHVEEEKRELVKDVHRLARLGVRLMDSTEGGVVANVHKQKVLAFEQGGYGVLKYQGRLCVPMVDGLQEMIMEVAHRSRYSIHPGFTKMYCDLIEVYWWSSMKKDIAEFVAKCPNCQQVKVEHQSHGVGEAGLIGPDLVHQAMEKVKVIQERLKTVQSRQKSYTNVRRRELEFEVDD
ncbi:hypothetical protein KY289_008609 [Solanum tuberosum]|nr:hypothetical protein KY289_008609 [Solanum tuberosum]